MKQSLKSNTKVDSLKIEIGKGTKEMRALQLMIQTYTNTPQVFPFYFVCLVHRLGARTHNSNNSNNTPTLRCET